MSTRFFEQYFYFICNDILGNRTRANTLINSYDFYDPFKKHAPDAVEWRTQLISEVLCVWQKNNQFVSEGNMQILSITEFNQELDIFLSFCLYISCEW